MSNICSQVYFLCTIHLATYREGRLLVLLVKEGARAREYEHALLWLIDCGLVHKAHRVSKPNIPLKVYEDLKAFKLFLLDIGLLSCMTHLSQKTLLDGNFLFKEFKGALTEQYVLQQLKTLPNIGVYYWTNERNTSEIDFLLDANSNIIPIEVTAETNLKSKSLRGFSEKYTPTISIRSSMSDYKKDDLVLNLPLYAISNILYEI